MKKIYLIFTSSVFASTFAIAARRVFDSWVRHGYIYPSGIVHFYIPRIILLGIAFYVYKLLATQVKKKPSKTNFFYFFITKNPFFAAISLLLAIFDFYQFKLGVFYFFYRFLFVWVH
jgi:hypothetical protein